jgi:endonuclease III
MMNENKIRDRLVEHGEALFKAPSEFVRFTNHDDSDRLLNDLSGHPHAFVLASIMDRQIKAERAWLIPFRFMEKLGNFSMETLLEQSESDVHRLMTEPEPLHRFVDNMATFFFKAIQRIAEQYDSDASLIWTGKPSSAIVVYRFLEFDGVGPKIASMDANILAREFKIEFSDYYSIDISADVHVRRVFGRLGLTPPDASIEQLIFRARGLNPEFPGLMDFPAWEIGRNWCRSKYCECGRCYMNDLCPSANQGTTNKALVSDKR